VIADVGEDLNQVGSEHVLRVAIVNLTTAAQVGFAEVSEPLKAEDDTPRRLELRASFPPLQNTEQRGRPAGRYRRS
jgi:hypothetical protein